MAHPDPAALRRRSAALRRTARSIDESDWWGLRPRAGDDTWRGPTATAFDEALIVAEHALSEALDALAAAAQLLDRQADEAHAALLRAQLAASAPDAAGPR